VCIGVQTEFGGAADRDAGQHPEHLHRQVHLVIRQPPLASTTICTHMQVVDLLSMDN
jgi:hypothetical protein